MVLCWWEEEEEEKEEKAAGWSKESRNPTTQCGEQESHKVVGKKKPATAISTPPRTAAQSASANFPAKRWRGWWQFPLEAGLPWTSQWVYPANRQKWIWLASVHKRKPTNPKVSQYHYMCLYVCMYDIHVYIFTYLFIYLFMNLFIYEVIYLWIYLFMKLFIYEVIYLWSYLWSYLFMKLFIYVLIFLSLSPCACVASYIAYVCVYLSRCVYQLHSVKSLILLRGYMRLQLQNLALTVSAHRR